MDKASELPTRAEKIRALGDAARKEAAARKRIREWKLAARETPTTTGPADGADRRADCSVNISPE